MNKVKQQGEKLGADSPTRPYERLKAWAACHDLALALYKITEPWPHFERACLSSECRDAALAAVSLIVRGSYAPSDKEFRRFLNGAIGKLARLGALTLLAKDLGFLTEQQSRELEILRDHASRLTEGLYRAIGRGSKKKAVRSGRTKR
ncbi:MAG: four helix bundle protein [Gemmatimonadales bacterium]